MFVLTMGSCRVDLPADTLGIPRTNLQGVYTTSDHLQGLAILRRERIVPEALRPHVFFGPPHPDRYKTLADLSEQKIDRAIIEVCRLRRYEYQGWIVMNHKNVGPDYGVPALDDAQELFETREELYRNLDTLREKLQCPMLLTMPATCLGFSTWYVIAGTVATWCERNRQSYFDPSLLVAKYGRTAFFVDKPGDYWHWSALGIEKIAAIYREWIDAPTKTISNTWRDQLP